MSICRPAYTRTIVVCTVVFAKSDLVYALELILKFVKNL